MKRTLNYISLRSALLGHKKGLGVIIDLREPEKFEGGHIAKAVNLPARQFSPVNYIPYTYDQIYLIDQNHTQAQAVAKKLIRSGYQNVYIITQAMDNINLATLTNGWNLDHQLRLLSEWLSFPVFPWLKGKSEI